MAISATVGPLLGDRLALLDERAALGEARPLITGAAARAGRPDPFPADHSPPRTAAVPGSRPAEPGTWQPPAPATGTEPEPGPEPEVGTEARYQIPDLINRVTRLAREIDDLEQSRARRSTAKGGTR